VQPFPDRVPDLDAETSPRRDAVRATIRGGVVETDDRSGREVRLEPLELGDA